MVRGSLILISHQQDFTCQKLSILNMESIEVLAQNTAGSAPTQIVYYDEIRRGSSIEEVDFNINPNLKAID